MSRVLDVQFKKSPLEKSSVKIGGAAPLLTVAVSEAGEPFVVPSFGVTVTTITSLGSPLPATDRSSESVVADVVVVRLTVPLTVQTYVNDTASESASVPTAVAWSTAFVPGCGCPTRRWRSAPCYPP